MVFNAVNGRFGIDSVVLEDRENPVAFLRRRVRKLGISTVAGQVAFQVFVAKALNALSQDRIREIEKQYSLNSRDIPKEVVHRVSSVNDDATIRLLKTIGPGLVLVSGTRIISKKVIDAVGCPLINIHAGITPKYRGVHGAYWALANDDPENCGVTVHCVDKGIDTGSVLSQQRIEITKKDNFATYPMLQLACGIDLLCAAIEAHRENRIPAVHPPSESKLWYHPTLFQYAYYRIIKHVK